LREEMKKGSRGNRAEIYTNAKTTGNEEGSSTTRTEKEQKSRERNLQQCMVVLKEEVHEKW
jgi:hypothetical protein